MRVYLEFAQLGYTYYTNVFDPVSKQYRRVSETRWEAAQFNNEYLGTTTLSGEEAASQVYASYRYRREYAEGVRAPTLWTQSIPFNSMQIPDGVAVDPFQMRPTTAVQRVRDAVRSREELVAEEALKRRTGADMVRGIRLHIEVSSLDPPSASSSHGAIPVLVACYAFSGTHRGIAFRTFVNGATGQVGGQRIPEPRRVALVVGGATLLLSFIMGGAVTVGGSTLFFWFLIPALLAMVAARYYPIIMGTVYEYKRVRDQVKEGASTAAGGGGGFGTSSSSNSSQFDPFANAEEMFRQRKEQEQQDRDKYRKRQEQPFSAFWEELQRRAQEQARKQGAGPWGGSGGYRYGQTGGGYQQQQSAQEPRSGAAAADPRGFYQTLGVTRNATKQEIQAAFRGLAMKYHPDRFSDAKEKTAAQEKFKKLSEAYSVLRDERKRKTYDLTGRS
ncbi:hypothetical protein BC832DRAFT_557070 [Gaertneriomyces semiglobifer]|nr:hypothetical protein BC832DRAFT_557070 [Gaertneriomyces semiglobifer]